MVETNVSASLLLLKGTRLTIRGSGDSRSKNTTWKTIHSFRPHSSNFSTASSNSFIFQPFDRFPNEIKRMIWRNTLPPGQKVHLSTPLYLYKIGPKQQYPAALHINHLSRQIVLEHYVIWAHHIKSRILWSECAVLPLCFDPLLDYLHVDIAATFYYDLKELVKYLLMKSSSLIYDFSKLEIGEQLQVPVHARRGRSNLTFPAEKEHYRMQILRYFHALKKENGSYIIPEIDI